MTHRITEGRLEEIEQAPREAMIARSEARILTAAYRLIKAYRDGHKDGSQECYLNTEQGDYRCPLCKACDSMVAEFDSHADAIGGMLFRLRSEHNGFIAPPELL